MILPRKASVLLTLLLFVTWAATVWNCQQAFETINAFNVRALPLTFFAFRLSEQQVAVTTTIFLLTLTPQLVSGKQKGDWLGMGLAGCLVLLNLSVLLPYFAINNQLDGSGSVPPLPKPSLFPSVAVSLCSCAVLLLFLGKLLAASQRSTTQNQ